MLADQFTAEIVRRPFNVADYILFVLSEIAAPAILDRFSKTPQADLDRLTAAQFDVTESGVFCHTVSQVYNSMSKDDVDACIESCILHNQVTLTAARSIMSLYASLQTAIHIINRALAMARQTDQGVVVATLFVGQCAFAELIPQSLLGDTFGDEQIDNFLYTRHADKTNPERAVLLRSLFIQRFTRNKY
jgi:hypothetical protein